MRRIAALAVAAVALAVPARLMACTCMPQTSERDAFQRAGAVFRGTPVSVRRENRPGGFPENVYTFRVHRWRKGGAGDTVEVRTGMGGGDCGHPFDIDRRYTVYAHRGPDGLSTSICSMWWWKPAPAEPRRRALSRPADGDWIESEG